MTIQDVRKIIDTQKEKELRGTGLYFIWENGCAADNMIEIFKENNIDFYYDHCFRLVADLYNISQYLIVDYMHVEKNKYEIMIEID